MIGWRNAGLGADSWRTVRKRRVKETSRQRLSVIPTKIFTLPSQFPLMMIILKTMLKIMSLRTGCRFIYMNKFVKQLVGKTKVLFCL